MPPFAASPENRIIPYRRPLKEEARDAPVACRLIFDDFGRAARLHARFGLFRVRPDNPSPTPSSTAVQHNVPGFAANDPAALATNESIRLEVIVGHIRQLLAGLVRCGPELAWPKLN